MNSRSVMVPLSQLQRSNDNVRRTSTDAEIPALAASIAAHGLLQNLGVRKLPANGAGKRRYEVVAGGRRLQALKLLVQHKRLPKDHSVPCLLVDEAQASGSEVSLAENVGRVALHPADQFDAFAQLQQEGLSSVDIAARFGMSERLVEQRLKLAAASPKLMAEYRDDRMTLEQLTAFAVCDDHAMQEHVWFEAPLFDRSAASIRRALTKTLVEGSDRRARFVGVEAYEQAGGEVRRDLFNEDAAYFADSQLLDRLVSEKLISIADKLREEGWSFVEVQPELDYEALARFGRVAPQRVALSAKDAKRLRRVSDRYDELVAEIGDDASDEQIEALDRMSAEIEALSRKQEHWSKKKLAEAGVLLSLTSAGTIQVTRGLVRPEKFRTKSKDAMSARAPTLEQAEKQDFSEALHRELTAYRTAGLREALASQPELALTALVHALALKTFFGGEAATCVDIRPMSLDLAGFGDGVGENPAIRALGDRQVRWLHELSGPDNVWQWLQGQTVDTKLELLAFLTASTINAVANSKHDENSERLSHAEELARASALNMSQWWRPTAAGYFNRVRKDQIAAAVAEQLGREAAGSLPNTSKQAMAAKAEQLLTETGWLPGPLRTVQTSSNGATAS
jgi:ParB family transcriptional regulator, chromosome partitioning protein